MRRVKTKSAKMRRKLKDRRLLKEELKERREKREKERLAEITFEFQEEIVNLFLKKKTIDVNIDDFGNEEMKRVYKALGDALLAYHADYARYIGKHEKWKHKDLKKDIKLDEQYCDLYFEYLMEDKNDLSGVKYDLNKYLYNEEVKKSVIMNRDRINAEIRKENEKRKKAYKEYHEEGDELELIPELYGNRVGRLIEGTEYKYDGKERKIDIIINHTNIGKYVRENYKEEFEKIVEGIKIFIEELKKNTEIIYDVRLLHNSLPLNGMKWYDCFCADLIKYERNINNKKNKYSKFEVIPGKEKEYEKKVKAIKKKYENKDIMILTTKEEVWIRNLAEWSINAVLCGIEHGKNKDNKFYQGKESYQTPKYVWEATRLISKQFTRYWLFPKEFKNKEGKAKDKLGRERIPRENKVGHVTGIEGLSYLKIGDTDYHSSNLEIKKDENGKEYEKWTNDDIGFISSGILYMIISRGLRGIINALIDLGSSYNMVEYKKEIIIEEGMDEKLIRDMVEIKDNGFKLDMMLQLMFNILNKNSSFKVNELYLESLIASKREITKRVKEIFRLGANNLPETSKEIALHKVFSNIKKIMDFRNLRRDEKFGIIRYDANYKASMSSRGFDGNSMQNMPNEVKLLLFDEKEYVNMDISLCYTNILIGLGKQIIKDHKNDRKWNKKNKGFAQKLEEMERVFKTKKSQQEFCKSMGIDRDLMKKVIYAITFGASTRRRFNTSIYEMIYKFVNRNQDEALKLFDKIMDTLRDFIYVIKTVRENIIDYVKKHCYKSWDEIKDRFFDQNKMKCVASNNHIFEITMGYYAGGTFIPEYFAIKNRYVKYIDDPYFIPWISDSTSVLLWVMQSKEMEFVADYCIYKLIDYNYIGFIPVCGQHDGMVFCGRDNRKDKEFNITSIRHFENCWYNLRFSVKNFSKIVKAKYYKLKGDINYKEEVKSKRFRKKLNRIVSKNIFNNYDYWDKIAMIFDLANKYRISNDNIQVAYALRDIDRLERII